MSIFNFPDLVWDHILSFVLEYVEYVPTDNKSYQEINHYDVFSSSKNSKNSKNPYKITYLTHWIPRQNHGRVLSILIPLKYISLSDDCIRCTRCIYETRVNKIHKKEYLLFPSRKNKNLSCEKSNNQNNKNKIYKNDKNDKYIEFSVPDEIYNVTEISGLFEFKYGSGRRFRDEDLWKYITPVVKVESIC